MNRKLCVELEIFELGCLYNAKKLENEGLFGSAGLSSPGCYLHYVMGHGGQPATLKHLLYMHEEGQKLFPDARVCVSAAGVDCYPLVTTAILLGCTMVRCGIEDTHLLSDGRRASSNAEIVENVVRIAQEFRKGNRFRRRRARNADAFLDCVDCGTGTWSASTSCTDWPGVFVPPNREKRSLLAQAPVRNLKRRWYSGKRSAGGRESILARGTEMRRAVNARTQSPVFLRPGPQGEPGTAGCRGSD